MESHIKSPHKQSREARQPQLHTPFPWSMLVGLLPRNPPPACSKSKGKKKKIGKQTEQARRSGTTLFFHMVPGKGFEAMMHSHNAARFSWRQLHCGGKGGAVLALWQARQHQGTQHGDTLPPSPPSAPQWGPVPSIPPPPDSYCSLPANSLGKKRNRKPPPEPLLQLNQISALREIAILQCWFISGFSLQG